MCDIPIPHNDSQGLHFHQLPMANRKGIESLIPRIEDLAKSLGGEGDVNEAREQELRR